MYQWIVGNHALSIFFRNVGDVQSDYVRREKEQESDSVHERDRHLWNKY